MGLSECCPLISCINIGLRAVKICHVLLVFFHSFIWTAFRLPAVQWNAVWLCVDICATARKPACLTVLSLDFKETLCRFLGATWYSFIQDHTVVIHRLHLTQLLQALLQLEDLSLICLSIASVFNLSAGHVTQTWLMLGGRAALLLQIPFLLLDAQPWWQGMPWPILIVRSHFIAMKASTLQPVYLSIHLSYLILSYLILYHLCIYLSIYLI